MAGRARRVRTNPPETKARARAKARTRTSIRATTGIQSEHDPFLRLSGCARHCAESWIGEGQGTGSENVMVARRCSRERATDQVDCFEGKQG